VKAMNVVEREGLIGRRLLMDDGDAAYAELAWAPKQKLFIDDRYDMFPEKVIYDFFDLSAGRQDWAKILARYDVEVVVWPKAQPLTQLMERSGDWTVIHRDKSWIAFVRNAAAFGFPLKELAGFLRARDHGRPPCRSVKSAGERLLAEMDRQLAALADARRQLAATLDDWDRRLAAAPEGTPARLLESLAGVSVSAGRRRRERPAPPSSCPSSRSPSRPRARRP